MCVAGKAKDLTLDKVNTNWTDSTELSTDAAQWCNT